MAEKQQKTRLIIPSDIDNLGRRVLGQMVIDFIQDRTAKGKDINNGSFARYSKEYKESRDFKTAGKSSLVNLRLTGDMMASIEVLSTGSGFIELGYIAGTDENDKAAWVSDFDNGPSRDFLGMSAKDLDQVVSSFKEVNPSAEDTRNAEARAILNRIVGEG